MSEYFEPILSKYQCGFRKGHSPQNCLLVMAEKWKKCLDKKITCGTLLTDLSKAFDCLPHKRLFAKHSASGCFDESSLKYMNNHLSDRKQELKLTTVLVIGQIFCTVSRKVQL